MMSEDTPLGRRTTLRPLARADSDGKTVYVHEPDRCQEFRPSDRVGQIHTEHHDDGTVLVLAVVAVDPA